MLKLFRKSTRLNTYNNEEIGDRQEGIPLLNSVILENKLSKASSPQLKTTPRDKLEEQPQANGAKTSAVGEKQRYTIIDEELDRAQDPARIPNFNNVKFTVSSTGTMPVDEIQLSSVPDIQMSEDPSMSIPNTPSGGSL